MSVKRWFRGLLQPHIFFVAAASSVGLLLLILVPPMQTFDEQDHFLRTYQLSQGNLLPDVVEGIPGMKPEKAPGAQLPLDVLGFSYNSLYSVRLANGTDQKDETLEANRKQFLGRHIDPSKTQAAYFPTAGAYSPVAYAPQIMALRIGTTLDVSITVMYYLGRVFMLAAWIGLIYAAIRLLPVGKWALVILALLPASVYQAVTFSADAMTNALVFVTIAFFAHMAFRGREITRRDIAIAVGLCVLLALCKSGFWAVALLFWAVPVARYASRRQYLLANGLISGLSIAAFALWFKLVAYLVPYMGAVNNPGEAIDNVAQTAEVLHRPFEFIWIFLRTYLHPDMFHDIAIGIGSYSWGEVGIGWLGLIVMVLLIAAGLVLAAFEKVPDDFIWWRRGVGLAVIALLIGFVSFSLYTVFTPVGADQINGIQGRYFIPYLAILIPVLAGLAVRYRRKLKLSQARLDAVVSRAYLVTPAIVYLLICMVISVFKRYYVE